LHIIVFIKLFFVALLLFHAATSFDRFDHRTRVGCDSRLDQFLVSGRRIPMFTNRLSDAAFEFRPIGVRKGYTGELKNKVLFMMDKKRKETLYKDRKHLEIEITDMRMIEIPAVKSM